jgi:hypothetical protein
MDDPTLLAIAVGLMFEAAVIFTIGAVLDWNA